MAVANIFWWYCSTYNGLMISLCTYVCMTVCIGILCVRVCFHVCEIVFIQYVCLHVEDSVTTS